ncbi:MAG: GNAT family N-acetyltransferase, partial [Myxococcota bacterium]
EDHHWVVVEGEAAVLGAAYFAPETMTQGTWNLYFIAVAPTAQGKGAGASLLAHVEEFLRQRGERVLLVETSGLESFALTRKFYRKNGYAEEARIREFYQAGEDKVVFWKALG